MKKVKNPKGRKSTLYKVTRGGSDRYAYYALRSATRQWDHFQYMDTTSSIRVVLKKKHEKSKS